MTATEKDEIDIDAVLADFHEHLRREEEQYAEPVAEIVAILKAKGYNAHQRGEVMRLVDYAFPWEEPEE